MGFLIKQLNEIRSNPEKLAPDFRIPFKKMLVVVICEQGIFDSFAYDTTHTSELEKFITSYDDSNLENIITVGLTEPVTLRKADITFVRFSRMYDNNYVMKFIKKRFIDKHSYDVIEWYDSKLVGLQKNQANIEVLKEHQETVYDGITLNYGPKIG